MVVMAIDAEILAAETTEAERVIAGAWYIYPDHIYGMDATRCVAPSGEALILVAHDAERLARIARKKAQ